MICHRIANRLNFLADFCIAIQSIISIPSSKKMIFKNPHSSKRSGLHQICLILILHKEGFINNACLKNILGLNLLCVNIFLIPTIIGLQLQWFWAPAKYSNSALLDMRIAHIPCFSSTVSSLAESYALPHFISDAQVAYAALHHVFVFIDLENFIAHYNDNFTVGFNDARSPANGAHRTFIITY